MKYQQRSRRSPTTRQREQPVLRRFRPRVLLIWAGIFLLFTCSAPLAPTTVKLAGPVVSPPVSQQVSVADAVLQPTVLSLVTSVPARPTAPVVTVSPTDQELARLIDRYLTDLTSAGFFSGAVLVAHGNQVILASGYGMADAERNIRNSDTTLFRLASLTKQFTAVGILELAQQNRLQLTDPICQYLDNCPAAWQPIQIKHLLNHTSGLVDYTDYLDYETSEGLPATPQQLVSRFRDQPLGFTPGDLFDYCNSGYVLLGLIIERVSGMSYPEYIRRAIFEPLGMKNSGYDASEAYDPDQAAPYSAIGQRAGFLNATTLFSAGGLYSTIGDLWRWNQALSDDTLLTQSWRDQMFTPGNGSYGYGWKIEPFGNRIRISHAGNMTGVSNFEARYHEQQLTIIVLSNLENANSAAISDYIAAQVLGS